MVLPLMIRRIAACGEAPVLLQRLLAQPAAGYATTTDVSVKKNDWAAVKIPEATEKDIAETTEGGEGITTNDLRSTSALGIGDGIKNHTKKWLQSKQKSPMEYIKEAEPILVEGPVVASYGSEDPALGCPVEYINLKGKSKENPAVCKYTGNRYYSLPHTWNKH